MTTYTPLGTAYTYLETQFATVASSYSSGLLPIVISILTTAGVLYFVILGLMVIRGVVSTPLSELGMSALKFGLIIALLGSTGFTATIIAAANALPASVISAGGGTTVSSPGHAMDVYFGKAQNLLNIVQAKWDKDKADMVGASGPAQVATTVFGNSAGNAVGAVLNPAAALQLGFAEVIESILVTIVIIVAGFSAVVGFVVYVFALFGLDVVLALTPIAIGCTLFTQTRWIFQGWLSQVLNYIFLMVIISIVTAMIIGLTNSVMAGIVGISTTTGVAGQTINMATNGASVVLASTTEVLLACAAVITVYILGTLFFMQAPQIASGIFGGAASGGHNFMAVALNRVLSRGIGGGSRGFGGTGSARGGSIQRGTGR